MSVARFVLVFSCVAVARSAHLPSYIVPCRASSPEFNKCILSNGRDAIPHLLKGDPKYHLPPLVPFKIDKVELKPNDRLTLTLSNVELYGLDTMEFKDVEVDLKNRRARYIFFARQLNISADYNIGGQILVVPISGEGRSNLQFGDATFEYSFEYDVVTKKDGKRYFGNLRPKINFTITKAHFNFENLFNGNKELGENTNKLLNENSQEVLKDFGQAVTEVITSIVFKLIGSLVYKIPYDEIILP